MREKEARIEETPATISRWTSLQAKMIPPLRLLLCWTCRQFFLGDWPRRFFFLVLSCVLLGCVMMARRSQTRQSINKALFLVVACKALQSSVCSGVDGENDEKSSNNSVSPGVLSIYENPNSTSGDHLKAGSCWY